MTGDRNVCAAPRQCSDVDPGVWVGLLLLARGQQRQVKVMIMSGKASRLPRLVRLVAGRNQLQRSYDKIEGAVLVALAGGQERSGELTSVTAPGIASAGMGARVPVWLNRHGQPAVPPPGQALLIFDAVLLAAAAAAGAAAGLLTIYGLCRLALDRRRLAAWESAWTLTGPRWTSRH